MLRTFTAHKIRLFLFGYGIILALLTVAMPWIPPIQAPDESVHHARAYGITQGSLLLQTPSGQQSGLLVDKNLIQFINGYLFNIQTPGYRPSDAHLAELKALRWVNQQEHFNAPNTSYTNPLIYLPQAAGIAIGMQFNQTIYQSYFLARFLSCATALALVFIALYFCSTNPLTIGLLILPMTLFQMAMPTADGISYGLALLCLCFFSYLHTKKGISQGSVATLTVLICLLITARMHAFPFLLLLLFLPPTSSNRIKVAPFIISAFITLTWIIWAITHTVDLRLDRALSTAQIAQHYFYNPGEWLGILQNTVLSKTTWAFYSESFIGILGWLHIPLPSWYYPLSWVCLAALLIASLIKSTKNEIFNSFSWLYCLIALLSCFIIFNALLLGWTPYPHDVIEGVQGRYFWIPASCLAFCLSPSNAFSKFSTVLLGLFLILNWSLVAHVYFVHYN